MYQGVTAKQKHPGLKKSVRTIRTFQTCKCDQKVSVEAKKLLYQKSLTDIQAIGFVTWPSLQ